MRKRTSLYSGQVFILSLMIMGAVLIAGLLLMSTFVKDLRLAVELSRSAEAFYAADSAMEWQLYTTFVDNNAPAPSTPFDNGAYCCSSGLIKNEFDPETGKGPIKTIGVSGRTRRGIEINF